MINFQTTRGRKMVCAIFRRGQLCLPPCGYAAGSPEGSPLARLAVFHAPKVEHPRNTAISCIAEQFQKPLGKEKGGFIMASVKKFTQAQVINQLRHNERTIQFPSNQDINPTLKTTNYSLTPHRNMSSYDYFKARKSELYCYRRSDVKVLAGWVITAPTDLNPEKYHDFFLAACKFLDNRYGKRNCIQSIVHHDESGMPHLHYCFIPTVPDPKHGGEKICANDVLNKKELRNFHPDFQKFLSESGIKATVHSGITKEQGGNRTVKELKAEREKKLTLNINKKISHTRQKDLGRWGD